MSAAVPAGWCAEEWAVALAAYTRRIVDAAPPLSPAQREALAALLRGSTPGEQEAAA